MFRQQRRQDHHHLSIQLPSSSLVWSSLRFLLVLIHDRCVSVRPSVPPALLYTLPSKCREGHSTTRVWSWWWWQQQHITHGAAVVLCVFFCCAMPPVARAQAEDTKCFIVWSDQHCFEHLLGRRVQQQQQQLDTGWSVTRLIWREACRCCSTTITTWWWWWCCVVMMMVHLCGGGVIPRGPISLTTGNRELLLLVLPIFSPNAQKILCLN